MNYTVFIIILVTALIIFAVRYGYSPFNTFDKRIFLVYELNLKILFNTRKNEREHFAFRVGHGGGCILQLHFLGHKIFITFRIGNCRCIIFV